MAQNRTRRRAIRLEALESRQLMAADISLTGGTLVLNGTSSADRAYVSYNGSTVKTTLNDKVSSYATSSVKAILFRGYDGDDYFRNTTAIKTTAYGHDGKDFLSSGSGNDYLSGGNDNDTIYGGNGNDTIRGNAGNDYLSGGDGADSIYGHEGYDKLYGGLPEWNAGDAKRNSQVVNTVFHEIGHNFDDESIEFTKFKAISGWVQNPSNKTGLVQGKSFSTGKLDTKGWYRKSTSSADFAEGYGGTNPFEDFATVFEMYFRNNRSTYAYDAQLKAKLAIVDTIVRNA